MTVTTSSAAVPGGRSGSNSGVSVERTDYVILVSLTGGLDAFTAPRLRRALRSVPGAECAVVVVDLSQVDFIDSAGLGVLVGLVRRARDLGVTTRFEGARPGVRRVLLDTGFDRVAIVAGSHGARSGGTGDELGGTATGGR